MFDLLKKLLRNDTPESSKRFNTIVSVFVLILITIITLTFIWFGKMTEDVLITIILGWFGLAGVTTAFTAFQRNNGFNGSNYHGYNNYQPQQNNPPEPIKTGSGEELEEENDRIADKI